MRECARLQSFPDSYDFVGGPYLVAHDDRTQQDSLRIGYTNKKYFSDELIIR